jgi:NADPH:quinone reductase-like Zn-dependent oxidoreductase
MNFLFKLGSNDVIDYETSRFENVVHNIDVVFDSVGGDYKLFIKYTAKILQVVITECLL